MTIRIFILPTQYDIIDFRFGRRPENILVRDFATASELQAYEAGVDAIDDEYIRIRELRMIGPKVTYTRHSEDPEIEAVVTTVEREFKTPAEATTYCQGLNDTEGLAAPLMIDDTDERFTQLEAWVAENR